MGSDKVMWKKSMWVERHFMAINGKYIMSKGYPPDARKKRLTQKGKHFWNRLNVLSTFLESNLYLVTFLFFPTELLKVKLLDCYNFSIIDLKKKVLNTTLAQICIPKIQYWLVPYKCPWLHPSTHFLSSELLPLFLKCCPYFSLLSLQFISDIGWICLRISKQKIQVRKYIAINTHNNEGWSIKFLE